MTLWSRCTAFAAVLLVAAAATAEPLIRRTTLLVSDPIASQEFYEALGFRVWLDWAGDQDPNDPLALPLTGSPGNSRVIVMAAADDYAGMIGLLAFDNPPLDSNRTLAGKLGVNDIIMMIEVTNFDDVAAAVMALDTPLLRPPGPYESNGPAGRKTGRNMLVRDPDGYVIEVTSVETIDPLN